MKLFQNKIQFLGHDIFNGIIKPILRSIKFANKFSNEIKDKKELQGFLSCLNYVIDFPLNLEKFANQYFNFQRLKKNPHAWSQEQIQIVKYINSKGKSLSCLGIPIPHAFMIVEIDASYKGFGLILKQRLNPNLQHLVRFHNGAWTGPQVHYSTIKKDVLSIVMHILKFQDDFAKV